MTTATPKASVNAETAQYGGITTSDGVTALAINDTVDLGRDSTDGVESTTWRIYAYPPDFTKPSGWDNDPSDADIFIFEGELPPQFSMDEWGKYLIRLTLKTADGNVTSQALAMSILSSNGLEDTAIGEEQQFGGWGVAMQNNWRIIDDLL